MGKKKRLPKEIAGVKIPKAWRKSKMLRSLMKTSPGRDLLAHSLTAGAGAAAAVLIGKQQKVTAVAKTVTRKGARSAGLWANALETAFSAAREVIRDADPPKRRYKPAPLPADGADQDEAWRDDEEKGGGLKSIEGFLVRQYGDKFTSRVIVAASVRAISVLIREHPLIAARLLGVGLARAAQVGAADVYDYVSGGERQDDPELPSGLIVPRQSLVPEVNSKGNRTSDDD
ncbi:MULTISPECIES: hypothetical protein [Sinorhizobium]|uniref:Uncharacterized protein n=1 Tax=Rhizobium fredii TaxID=380 RepID=A0A2L0H8D2_RHIFR|nr:MULTISPECIES: hypothetical protein [Sinorhizobium]ASY58061.1 hypothetical protein SS05631_c31390 [Sinorhizobium sp. CCBAU 05631]AUX77740.1 hypothetical protein NXT3_CH03195 [Sinorhizobium fredii]